MFEELSGKFGKLKMPEGSLLKKLERLKKSSSKPQENDIATTLVPEMIERLKKVPEEISRKIDEAESRKISMLKANSDAVKNLEGQISKLDQAVILTKNGNEEFNRRLEKIDKTVLELLPLYEVIPKTANPINEKITRIDKRIEDIYNKPPEVPPKFIEDFENKFKNLEKDIEDLKKTVESKAIDENAFVEKVAVMVVERIRPRKKHRDLYGAPPIMPTAEQPASPARPAPQYMVEDEEDAKLAYLDNRPDTSIILLNWIEFLMEKVGRNNLFDVLEYYIEIGWINRDVCSKMMAYASGIDYFVDRPSWKLLPEDHTKSLMFIEQLSGNKVDRILYSKLERDVNKIIRNNKELTIY
jgi:archaeal flagellar protein FlaD